MMLPLWRYHYGATIMVLSSSSIKRISYICIKDENIIKAIEVFVIVRRMTHFMCMMTYDYMTIVTMIINHQTLIGQWEKGVGCTCCGLSTIDRFEFSWVYIL